MNNPYPTKTQLHAERLADKLIADQEAATAAYLAALNAFAKVVDEIDWPLGCPVVGYDTQAVHGTIADLMTVNSDFEDAAMDAARAEVMA